jgi:hypothetical protein
MASKARLIDRVMEEVILYGGMPLRRRDVYRDALACTGSAKAADYFAFRQQEVLDETPLTWQAWQTLWQSTERDEGKGAA